MPKPRKQVRQETVGTLFASGAQDLDSLPQISQRQEYELPSYRERIGVAGLKTSIG